MRSLRGLAGERAIDVFSEAAPQAKMTPGGPGGASLKTSLMATATLEEYLNIEFGLPFHAKKSWHFSQHQPHDDVSELAESNNGPDDDPLRRYLSKSGNKQQDRSNDIFLERLWDVPNGETSAEAIAAAKAAAEKKAAAAGGSSGGIGGAAAALTSKASDDKGYFVFEDFTAFLHRRRKVAGAARTKHHRRPHHHHHQEGSEAGGSALEDGAVSSAPSVVSQQQQTFLGALARAARADQDESAGDRYQAMFQGKYGGKEQFEVYDDDAVDDGDDDDDNNGENVALQRHRQNQQQQRSGQQQQRPKSSPTKRRPDSSSNLNAGTKEASKTTKATVR